MHAYFKQIVGRYTNDGYTIEDILYGDVFFKESLPFITHYT